MGSFEKCAGSFAEADALLQGRNKMRRKVHGNTTLERCGEAIALRLHSTDVVTFYPDGRIRLDNGGWPTVTSKDRINRCLPEGWGVFQADNVWYLSHGYRGDRVWIFRNGMTIMPDGDVEGADLRGSGADKAKRDLDKAVLQYVDGYVEALFEGKVSAPSGGDCWYCAMQTQDGKPLGEAIKDHQHVLDHVREGYYVPSMVVRACETFGVSIHAKGVLGMIFNSAPSALADGIDWGNIARSQIHSSLKRYVRRAVGLAA